MVAGACACAMLVGCTKQAAAPAVQTKTVVKDVPTTPTAPCDTTAMQAFASASGRVTQAFCATGTAPGSKRPTQWALVLWESGPAGGESAWVYLKNTSEMICGNTTSCWTAADPAVDGMWDQNSQATSCSGGGAMDLRQLASCIPDDAAATIWVAMRAAEAGAQSPGASASPSVNP